MPLIDLGPAPVPAKQNLTDLGPAPLTDLGPAPATHEDALHLAGTEIVRQNRVRDQQGLDRLNENETGAIMDAYRLMAGKQPDKLRSQISEETAKNTQLTRGIIGDARAAAFENLTSYVPNIAGLIDPETGLQLKAGQERFANVNPDSTTGKVAGFATGMAKFVVMGPVAIAEAGLGGAGEQRMAIANGRKAGRETGGLAEAGEVTARGIVDGVMAKMFMKVGGRASNVVRSMIEPQVRVALAKEGIDTARKLAWAWAADSIKVGALSETQYLADVGLGHLADPSIVPTTAEAAKAAAFGIVLPSAMGLAHGLAGRAKRSLPAARDTTVGDPSLREMPEVPGTEKYPLLPPAIRPPEGQLAVIPKTGPEALIPARPGTEPIYSGERGRPLVTEPPANVGIQEPVQRPADVYPHEGGVEELPVGPAQEQPREPIPVPDQFRQPAEGYPQEGGFTAPEPPPPAVPQPGEGAVRPPTSPSTRGIEAPAPKETIQAAAIQLPSGQVFEGPAHANAYMAAEDAKAPDLYNGEAKEGFTTSTGRFVSREEALKIAKGAKQTKEQKRQTALRSEQLSEKLEAPVTRETEIHPEPLGSKVATPHVSYDQADRASVGGEMGTPVSGTGEHDNLWVRPAASGSNGKRTLLIQFSTNLVSEGRARTSADDYGDKLYKTRPGYSRPTDFWELPQWIGVAAHNLPNSDVYVVRSLAEGREFLAQAGYGEVALSVLDANNKLAQSLIEGYKGKVAVGGYTDLAPFKGRSNVRTFTKMGDWIGKDFKDGTDYRHFRNTETQPRLQLSSGCLHKCGFCSMPREIVKTTPEGVAQQIKSFGDLKYRMVYLNDKTFGQADNYKNLVEINTQLKAANPDFEGFIIQTTSSQMMKFTPEFLKESGIKYVELGVESYNDPILKPLHKPSSEKLIDEATQKIRENGLKLIPNIIVGIPDETAATYGRTLDYLERNKDVISHVNVNNLALYSDTELTKKIGKIEVGDTEQNVVARSFHKEPAVHQAAYDAFTKVGSDALEPPATAEAKTNWGNLFSDETGAVAPEAFLRAVGGEDVVAAARAAADTISSAAADLQRTFSPGSRGEKAKLTTGAMRQENSRAHRKADVRYEAYDKARRAFNTYARQNGQVSADDFMDRINRGEKQADTKLQPLADAMDAERRLKVKDIQALGVGAGEKFDEDWFGRQWKDQGKARLFFMSRRPLTGSKTFLKGRVLESVAEGRAAGLELVTDNPVEMHIMKMGEMDKFINGVRVIKTLEANGAAARVRSGEAIPQGWQQIHDQIGLYKAKNPVTGEVEHGSFYAPEEVATLINNHLSPGLRNKGWFRTYLGAANMMNQFQLGMSGFHIAFTSADAIVSKIALGLREGINYGDVGHAVTDILQAPVAPVTNILRGSKGLAEWTHPGTQSAEVQNIIHILEDAGAQLKSDPMYRTHVTDNLMAAWRKGNALGAFGRAILLPVELPTRFIMDVIVPRQKLGVAMDLVRMEMRNNPGMSHEALVAKARMIWDSADNRMGQLVYDNLFWNHMTKDIAMATVRSVGWNLGTFREVLGGGMDFLTSTRDMLKGKRFELTNRTAYIVALPMVHAMVGSVLNYAFTGEPPKELRDAFFPRTGGVDERGNPARVSLPTYMKDIYHFMHEPLKTMRNKIHPALNATYEMLANKDFYGVKIRNEDDPIMQQVIQEAKYVVGSLEPLSSRNLRQGLGQGQSVGQASKSFIGLTPAPTVLNETLAERVASDMVRESIPVGARTREEADKAKLKRGLRSAVRQGDMKTFSDAIGQQRISHSEARDIIKESGQSPLAAQLGHLDAKESLKVWAVATPEERQEIRVLLLKKLSTLRGRATPNVMQETVAEYQRAGVIQ